MSIVIGFAPWIVYWVLVGNVPFETAVLVALAVAVAGLVIGRVRKAPGITFEIGAVATFLALTILTVHGQPGLHGALAAATEQRRHLPGRPGRCLGGQAVRAQFATADQPAEVVNSAVFQRITLVLTWIWVAAFAGMTISSAIPPIVQGDATILDTKTPLSFLFYWVIPFSLMGLAALATRLLPARMVPGDDTVRETSFVAYSEAAIDELYYLATEHANREVGPGKEAYDVRVGGMGIPLTGDDTRKSWPSTYKVRDRRR